MTTSPSGEEMKVLMGDTGASAHLQLTDGNIGPGPIIEESGTGNSMRTGPPETDTPTVEIVGTKARVSVGGETE